MLKILDIPIILLLLITYSKEDIPESQKKKCEKVAKSEDDCLVELDDSYFCCYAKAKTNKGDHEANLCVVVEAEEINEMVIKELLEDFVPFLKDAIFQSVDYMTAFSIFYNLMDFGIKDSDLVCPIDPSSKKGIIISIVIGVLVVVVFIGFVYCCCKKEKN